MRNRSYLCTKWNYNQIIVFTTFPDTRGLIPKDLEFGSAVLHDSDPWSRQETLINSDFVIMATRSFRAVCQHSLLMTVRIPSCTWSLRLQVDSAVGAGYIAGRCLCDQENTKIPRWNSSICILCFWGAPCTHLRGSDLRCVLPEPGGWGGVEVGEQELSLGPSQPFAVKQSLGMMYTLTFNTAAIWCTLYL